MTKVPKDVLQTLGPGEEVELYIEKKIYHPKLNIDSMALTSQRIIFRHPEREKLKKSHTDLSYTELANTSVESGPLRSKIIVQLKAGGDPLILDNFSNADAEKAAGVIRTNIAKYQTPLTAGYPTPVTVAAVVAPSTGAKCGKCGRVGRSDAKYCDACGSKLK